MASLAKRLRSASYNGINFYVLSGSWKGGRRTVTHEYPQRDAPYVEDMGKATDTFTLECFVSGSDYIQKSKNLMKAFQTEGTGSLVHPWLGEMQVQVVDTSEIAWDLKLGQATFSVTFLEPGKLENPNFTSSWADKLRGYADNLYSEAVSTFAETFPSEGLAIASVVSDVVSNYTDIITALEDSKFARMFDGMSSLTELASSFPSLISETASVLGADIGSIFDISGDAESERDWAQSTLALSSSATMDCLSAHHDSRMNVDKNSSPAGTYYSAVANDALEKLTRQSLLSSMLGAVSMIGTDIDTQADQLDSDTLISLRAQVLNALEQEMIFTERDCDDTYLTLSDAYSAVYQDLTSRLISMGGMVDYTPTEVGPVLAIAYDQYEDAERDIEIVRRNGIRHPLFCPVKTLRLEKE